MRGAAGTSGPAVLWEDAWDAPGPRFEGFVEDCVRRRLGKYRQPAHPMRLSVEEALALFKKVRRVIVDTERKARASAAMPSLSRGGRCQGLADRRSKVEEAGGGGAVMQ